MDEHDMERLRAHARREACEVAIRGHLPTWNPRAWPHWCVWGSEGLPESVRDAVIAGYHAEWRAAYNLCVALRAEGRLSLARPEAGPDSDGQRLLLDGVTIARWVRHWVGESGWDWTA